jgi:hypothetical protein
MRFDPNSVRQQIYNLLAQHPELAEDEILLSDMIEGETQAFDFLSAVVRKIGEAQALAGGLDQYISELSERKKRIGRREEGLRKLAFDVMQAAGLPKAELPEATISVRAGRPKVIITDDASLPDRCFRIKKEVDKKQIEELLKSGREVPGAALSNAEPVLTIRIKA